jgi:hypothetical protein
MASFKHFLQGLGDLHDARIADLVLDVAQQTLDIEIVDLFSNFKGLPDYRGPTRGRIAFRGVSRLNTVRPPRHDPLIIYEFSVLDEDTENRTASLKLSPAGLIEFDYVDVQFPTLPAPN